MNNKMNNKEIFMLIIAFFLGILVNNIMGCSIVEGVNNDSVGDVLDVLDVLDEVVNVVKSEPPHEIPPCPTTGKCNREMHTYGINNPDGLGCIEDVDLLNPPANICELQEENFQPAAGSDIKYNFSSTEYRNEYGYCNEKACDILKKVLWGPYHDGIGIGGAFPCRSQNGQNVLSMADDDSILSCTDDQTQGCDPNTTTGPENILMKCGKGEANSPKVPKT